VKQIAEYWREGALAWDESSYARRLRGLSLVEKLATFSRAHIRERHATAERVLSGWIDGKTFVEIGCGGGELAVALAQQGGRGTGLDVSEAVLEAARRRAGEAGVADRLAFVSADVAEGAVVRGQSPDMAEPDLAVGLGILEYLTPAELEALVQKLGARDVFFSFHERRPNAQAALHWAYRRLKRMPLYTKYRAAELRALLARAGYPQTRVFREGKNAFVTSLRD
jgi:SAM-dependent methyltransferase